MQGKAKSGSDFARFSSDEEDEADGNSRTGHGPNIDDAEIVVRGSQHEGVSLRC